MAGIQKIYKERLDSVIKGKNIDWAGEAIDLTSDGAAIIALDNGRFGFVKTKPF